ncbi:MAG TPA: hypothetical protein VKE22_14425 [Haliangiales bacterium]|nr:hypothetical protein [Haliangiales bacterium]
MRWVVLALTFQGCVGNCGPNVEPLPPTVAGPAAALSRVVGQGWTLDAYLRTRGNVYLVGMLDAAVAPVNDALSFVAADVGRVMLQPGAGQGGGGIAQPTSYDADQAVWDRMGGRLTLGLRPPYAWQLVDSAGSMQAWSQGLPEVSVDLAVESRSHGAIQLRGTLAATLPVDRYRAVEVHHIDGDRDLRLASRATDTGVDDEFETYADVTGGGAAERVSVKIRWRHDLAGRADATFSEGDLGAAAVVATECWTQQGDGLAVVYYADSAGLRPTTGTESACVVTQVTP